MMTKSLQMLFLTLALASPWSVTATADVIFDNGTYSTSVLHTSNPEGGSFLHANSFVLQDGASTITDIHWWGSYVSDTAVQNDDFTIQIFADDGGIPDVASALFLDLNVGNAVNRMDTGDDYLEFNIYSYSADFSPLQLDAGTVYWVSIFNNPGPNPGPNWAWMEADGTYSGSIAYLAEGFGTGWQNNAYEGRALAFQLTNDGVVVPEPASITLLGLGIAGLVVRMRRRKA